MTVRPPNLLRRKPPPEPLAEPLEQEILAEKAATYGRLVKRLEKALAALSEAGRPEEGEGGRDERDRLLEAAGEALWYVMIQRDLCGFSNSEWFMREMKVPRAVRLRMGISRARSRRASPSHQNGLSRPFHC